MSINARESDRVASFVCFICSLGDRDRVMENRRRVIVVFDTIAPWSSLLIPVISRSSLFLSEHFEIFGKGGRKVGDLR